MYWDGLIFKLVEQSSLISTSVGPKFVQIADAINEYVVSDSVFCRI